ncbi:MAG: transglycosylase family protein, partial [Acidobacteriota bacterium]
VLSPQSETEPPTPTLFAQTAQKKVVDSSPIQPVDPTPTIYIAPTIQAPAVLGSKAISTDEVIEPPVTSTTLPQPTQLPTATPIPQPAVNAGDLESLFDKYSSEFNIDKEDLKRIAQCESGFNSASDTGVYAGMFQFHANTWTSTRNAMGLDANPELRKNAEEAIRTAAYKVSHGGRGAWPNC